MTRSKKPKLEQITAVTIQVQNCATQLTALTESLAVPSLRNDAPRRLATVKFVARAARDALMELISQIEKVPTPVGPKCPNCSSEFTYELQYGFPGHDCISGDEAKWYCRKCAHEWGKAFPGGELRDIQRGKP